MISRLEATDIEDSLFETSTGLIDFVVIKTELRQISQYGFDLIAFSSAKLDALKEVLRSRLKSVEEEIELPTWEEEVELPNWEDNVEFVTPTLLLVALYIFCEKSLKNLCYSFTDRSSSYEIPKGARFKVRLRKGESNIDAQIRYLINKCRFNFALDDHEKRLLDQCRQLRNDFAHGDWSNVRSALKTVSFQDALGSISSIFAKIEDGMPLR